MLEVLIAAFVVGMTHAVPPGPVTFEVLRRGAAQGLAPALLVDAGAVAADAVFFVLIVFGLSQVIASPNARLALWLCGSALLMFLGLRGVYKALAEKRKPGVPGASGRVGKEMSPFLTGFLICITSPFAIIWWTSIFAGSMVIFDAGVPTMVLVFAGIAAACLAWYAFVGLSGRLSRALLNPATIKALSLVCSAMMIVFALLLLYKGYGTFL